MNKSELITAVSAHTDVSPKMVAAVLNGTEDVISSRVKQGEKVVISGFVSFERVERKARTARNPRTGEEIKVKATKAPRVAAGATLKKIVSGKAPAPRVNSNGRGRATAASGRATAGGGRGTTVAAKAAKKSARGARPAASRAAKR